MTLLMFRIKKQCPFAMAVNSLGVGYGRVAILRR